MTFDLRITTVPASTLGTFIEACATHATDDLAELGNYAGFSLSTARRAVPTLESLGLIERTPTGMYTVTAPGVRRGMTDEQMRLILRSALLGYRPFEAISEGLALGESEGDALRKALLLLGLQPTDMPKLQALVRLGEDLEILDRSNGQVVLVAEFAPTDGTVGLSYSATDLESNARARLFIAKTLGRDANDYLDAIDRGLLADALVMHETDPRKSIENTGQALEDFLRHVADDAGYGVEGKKASGAGQLANVLYSKGAIHNHHQKLVDAVATVRNATAHRKDKKTLSPWELTPFGALSAHAMALTAIRSIHHFTREGHQTI